MILSDKTDIGLNVSVRKEEDQEIRSRFLKLNGKISEQKIEIEEEGTREIDLTGNVIADVAVEFAGFPERITIPLFADGDGNNNRLPEVTALKFVDVVVPQIQAAFDTIRAILLCDYVYRHVQSGWN